MNPDRKPRLAFVSSCSALIAAWLLMGLAAPQAVAAPWLADQGDGTYKNPVLFADYSDPDVVRVGEDFYMTASSFNCVPGLPVLHSRDLVNWQLIGHAVDRLPKRFDKVQHGNGLWAPSIRHHDDHYWIFVGDPDRGILMTRARDPRGPWTPLHVVEKGAGLIDPCPLWDDDGKAYLVHAYAKSRAGKNSILVAREMAPDGSRLLGEEQLVIDGRDEVHPTIEGPKFYKRNGWYYILAPAGGVKPGWQLAARSRQPFGPYEVNRVMEQGTTDINGPHQGGWVELPSGENWFVHFQDRLAFGRVVHLNPVRWVDGWPMMGEDFDGNGVGEPLSVHKMPDVGKHHPRTAPPTSDEFDRTKLGLQWQWQANPQPEWMSLDARPGWLRLTAVAPSTKNLTAVPNQLLQKFPAPEFTATTLLEFAPGAHDSQAGLVVMGLQYAGLMVRPTGEGLQVEQMTSMPGGRAVTTADGETKHRAIASADAGAGPIWLQVSVEPDARCTFRFSTDGEAFTELGEPFFAEPGRWIGAKVGLVAIGDGGHADFGWFRIE